jgi:glycosyltransferase involved in cell wall biosynthesis
LVSIGRLAGEKGQLLLIEAAALLKRVEPDFEIVLIGDGPMRAQLQKAITDRGLGSNVRLVGWMDSAGVREQLLLSRALVMPSFAEGLPVVIMEALALGRPVLSTSIAGVPELVKDGTNGWLVPAGSAEALAEGMRRALGAGTDQLAAMGRSGIEAVSREHNASIEAGKLAEAFGAPPRHK